MLHGKLSFYGNINDKYEIFNFNSVGLNDANVIKIIIMIIVWMGFILNWNCNEKKKYSIKPVGKFVVFEWIIHILWDILNVFLLYIDCKNKILKWMWLQFVKLWLYDNSIFCVLAEMSGNRRITTHNAFGNRFVNDSMNKKFFRWKWFIQPRS